MLRHLAAAAAVTLAACRPAPPATPATSPELDARLARIEERLDRLTANLGEVDAAAVPATPDIRLMRVEQQLAKVVDFLKKAVPPTLDSDRTYAIPVDPLDPVLGPAGAAVTLVEAYEYLCPYCAMLEPTLEDLRRRYPRDLRVVSKHFVIHGEPAKPTGKAACAAARQGKFAAMHAALWKAIWPEQGQIEREQATEAAVEKLAKDAGLDMKRYRTDVAGPCNAWIDSAQATLSKFGAGGTPSFWLNGRPIEARNADELARLIDAELARVKASGVKPAAYYQDVVMAKGEPEAVMTSPFD